MRKLNDILDKKGLILKKGRLAADLKRYDLLPELERELVEVNQEISQYLKAEEEKKMRKREKKTRTKDSNSAIGIGERPPPT